MFTFLHYHHVRRYATPLTFTTWKANVKKAASMAHFYWAIWSHARNAALSVPRVQCQAIIVQSATISFGIILIVWILVPMGSILTVTIHAFNAMLILQLVLSNPWGTISKHLLKIIKCMLMSSSIGPSVSKVTMPHQIPLKISHKNYNNREFFNLIFIIKMNKMTKTQEY